MVCSKCYLKSNEFSEKAFANLIKRVSIISAVPSPFFDLERDYDSLDLGQPFYNHEATNMRDRPT